MSCAGLGWARSSGFETEIGLLENGEVVSRPEKKVSRWPTATSNFYFFLEGLGFRVCRPNCCGKKYMRRKSEIFCIWEFVTSVDLDMYPTRTHPEHFFLTLSPQASSIHNSGRCSCSYRQTRSLSAVEIQWTYSAVNISSCS